MFSAFLQLSTLFTAMAVGIWIDRVFRDAFQRLAAHAVVYQAASVIVAVVSVNAGVPPLVHSFFFGTR